MTTRISINGVIGDAASATISPLDRGFLYGDSVYEVMRTYGGEPFGEGEHLDRLQRSADLLGIRVPLERPALVEEIRATLAAAGNAESYCRVVITRGSGPIGLDPALADNPCRVIIVTELKPYPAELYERGAELRLVPTGRAAEGGVAPGAKSGNYLVNILALGIAKRQGAHEAVMLDAAGRVTEGSSSNVFIVRGGVVSTPPLSAGILEGITRRKVMELARQHGLRVDERQVYPADLEAADEVFITSSIREVLPVTSVDGRSVGGGCPGPVTRRVHALYLEAVPSRRR